ncbi:hypothetical protein [Cupriavidus pauculus]|uniref:hypothetical protein n=1 Tax=Cupriavidus pauculus TaxID=82633 RepID=UPI001D0C80BF|nr:hypothetical protein [Cupriavidus pauculus]
MTEKRKGGALARLAGQLCNNPEFRRMVAVRTGRPCESADDAKASILERCGVKSRADLDHIPEAEAEFHAGFRLPWMRWQKEARR